MIELRPSRDLLDPEFAGYKLSIDPVPCYQYNLEDDVYHILPSDDQYSLLHAKVFGLHNHLYADVLSEDNLYYVDERWRLRRVRQNNLTGRFEGLHTMWEMTKHHPRKPGHYNPSLSFTSADFAVVSDGAGSLYIVYTGNREEADSFQTVHVEEPCGEEKAFKVIHSRCISEGGHKFIHCLLLHIETRPEEEVKESKEKGVFTTLLEWLIFNDGGIGKWSLHASRQVSTVKGIEYAAIETYCTALYVASEKPVVFTKDSEKPVEDRKIPEQENMQKPKRYMWLQNQEDITVWLQLAESVVKQDIHVKACADCLTITCRGQNLLEGDTCHRLNTELPAVWTLEKGKLELTLNKEETGLMWSCLLKGCDEGEQIMDPALVAEIHERLAHLCSETESSGGCVTTFNSEQLEECDEVSSSASFLHRLCPQTHSTTHKVTLGGLQWLFSCQLKPERAPAMCLRHDVDGCVWQPYEPGDSIREKPATSDDKWPLKHVGTFFALGYIQAGKSQRKFSVCSPDLSYVAICEATRHIYIYRQPCPVNGELRNRRTGRHVKQVAVQQLLNLDSQEEILGVHASIEFLYVLTPSTMYAFHINVKD
ncbi:nudC domain-containing protein 1 [Schistocerca piceifrons]|uniref:nudC domain-containing protein 1 n=1 Tax=Schistocerca piceifrons TaxID=274613 RepID=UPI001F5FC6C5|nr:nudC domain-containing protein 1 [Schistocerca piceifrons]